MEDIFSDDEEFEAIREQLYDGKPEEEDDKLIPMFGMYSLFKKSNQQKPRQDLFLRALVPPSNDPDPYKQGSFESKKPVLKKSNLYDNFSFFGMRQQKIKLPTESLTIDYAAERKKQLEELELFEKNSNKNEEENKEEQMENDENKRPQKGTPKPSKSAKRKRRRVVVDSEEESDSDEDVRFTTSPSIRSPRKKRISPEMN